MSIASARALAATLAPKQPGHLITASDWNSLISVLLEYGDGLLDASARLAVAEAAILALDNRVDALDGLPARVQILEDQTAPLRENYLLTARTIAETVLVGQTAEIVFRATALDGSALRAPLPWLDVVTTWGRLAPVAGFTVRENAEENALSVQFNAAGEVRVRLRSQHARGVTAAQEGAFQNAMTARIVANGPTFGEAIASAGSPQDASVKQAYATMSTSYDSSANVRQYADAYHVQQSGSKFKYGKATGAVIARGEWETYRATVMAFAKPDAAAATADPTRGVATVQVSFREWIADWSDDYVQTFELDRAEWEREFNNKLNRDDLIPDAARQLDLHAKSGGALQYTRKLKAFEKAAELINPAGDPRVMQNKALLKVMAHAQMASPGADSLAASAFAQQAQVTAQASQIARVAQATASDAASTKQAVLVLETRVKAAEQSGKEISAGLKNIGDGVRGINVAEVSNLGQRLNVINESLVTLGNRITRP